MLRLFFAISVAALAATTMAAAADSAPRDGQHDFDFNLGSWHTHIKTLRKSPAGGYGWVEFDGTAEVRPVWNGHAQLEEIEADGAPGHFEALILFLYDPQSHQWNKTFASSADGQLGVPMVGEFRDGQMQMLSQDGFHGRTVLMSAVWSDVSANSQHFEEASSDDGGRSWAPYFIADVTRIPPAPAH